MLPEENPTVESGPTPGGGRAVFHTNIDTSTTTTQPILDDTRYKNNKRQRIKTIRRTHRIEEENQC